MPPKIKIGIIGAGIAGSVLAVALSKYAHIEFVLYEEASEFPAQNTGVGLTKNAQDALKMALGPGAADLIESSTYVNLNNVTVKIVRRTPFLTSPPLPS